MYGRVKRTRGRCYKSITGSCRVPLALATNTASRGSKRKIGSESNIDSYRKSPQASAGRQPLITPSSQQEARSSPRHVSGVSIPTPPRWLAEETQTAAQFPVMDESQGPVHNTGVVTPTRTSPSHGQDSLQCNGSAQQPSGDISNSRYNNLAASPDKTPTSVDEITDYHEGIDSISILSEALGGSDTSAFLQQALKTNHQSMISNTDLDSADEEYLRCKGAYDLPPPDIWYVFYRRGNRSIYLTLECVATSSCVYSSIMSMSARLYSIVANSCANIVRANSLYFSYRRCL